MTVKFAISLVIRPAEVGRPRSCAPVAVSVAAHLVKGGKLEESCIRTGAYPANPRLRGGSAHSGKIHKLKNAAKALS